MHWNRCIQAMCSTVACCNSILLCHPVCADRSGMAAARFHAAAAACGILLCFAAENCTSHCNGCMKVANGALAADFLHFVADDFPFKFSLKSLCSRCA